MNEVQRMRPDIERTLHDHRFELEAKMTQGHHATRESTVSDLLQKIVPHINGHFDTMHSSLKDLREGMDPDPWGSVSHRDQTEQQAQLSQHFERFHENTKDHHAQHFDRLHMGTKEHQAQLTQHF